MTHNEFISSSKAILWEEAKGKLRALAAVAGSGQSGDKSVEANNRRQRWTKLDMEINAFVNRIEAEGLQE